MTKTAKKTKKVSISDIEVKASAYREVWLRKAQLEEQLIAMREEISQYAEDYFTKHPNEKMSMRLGGCKISHKLVSVVQLPEDMASPNSKKLQRFARQFPQAVKMELRKSELKNIDLGAWGIEIAEGRKVEIEVADREEVANG